MPTTDYDVIIVGARVAGASLAMRLGARGHRVLLLDKAKFPSLPSVPSSPIVYAGVMAILDELGVDESSYADTGVPVARIGFEFGHYFSTVFEMPKMWGRGYAYCFDRERFDAVLWEHAGRTPGVERRAGFAVDRLLHAADGRVVGVAGAADGAELEQLRARCVIGADGRFSPVARAAGAEVVREANDHCSTTYYALWEGFEPFRPGFQGALAHVSGRGLDMIALPMPGGRTLLNTHARADRAEIAGDAQAYYVDTLRSLPSIAARLRNAKQVSHVSGIKKIANGYRRVIGPGWALVGDAAHYKDPIDGQGIYDALIGARLVADALEPWLRGQTSWDAAAANYVHEFEAETLPMYEQTVTRLRRELYDEPPELVIKTLARWTTTDPIYQQRFLHYLGRTISPTGWNAPKFMLAAAGRGLLRDLGIGRARN